MKIDNEKLLNDFYKHDKLNVLVLTDMYFPSFGGVSFVADNLCKALIETNKANVVLVTGYVKGYKDKEDYAVIRTKSLKIPKKFGDSLPLPGLDFKLKKLIKKLKIDVIHIHTVFTMCKFGLKLGKTYNIPVVMHGHSKYNEEYPTHIKNKFICNKLIKAKFKLNNQADFVTPVSNGTKDCYLKNGVKTPMQVLENTSDFTLCQAKPEIIESIEKKYNFDHKKDNVLVLVTRLEIGYKNLDFLLYSLKELKDLGTKFKFLLVGCGKDEEKLKHMSKELGISDDLIFVGEIRDRELLKYYYYLGTLLCFPSIKETSGIIKYEGASQKTATIGIDGFACTEDIVNDYNGYKTANDPKAYAKKIHDVLLDKEKLNEISLNAYKTLNKTWVQKANELLEIYNKLITQKHN